MLINVPFHRAEAPIVPMWSTVSVCVVTAEVVLSPLKRLYCLNTKLTKQLGICVDTAMVLILI